MELILLIGIQATGKSSFYKESFVDSHLRINLDMLKTRHRERNLVELCLDLRQPFVVDNTNASRKERARYFELVNAARPPFFKVKGFYFESKIEEALRRNSKREGKARIPEAGVRATHKRLELPNFDEGFDELHFVRLAPEPIPFSSGLSPFVESPWREEG